MYAVILAGGGGTRLWPLSRRNRPKPFLPLFGDETLFQRTLARIRPVVGDDGTYVVVERRHIPLVREQAPSLDPAHVLAEPMGRNTAAAVALAALAIDRPDDDVMLVLPADAFIRDEDRFRDLVAGPVDAAARSGRFVTLGIRPDRPATGYGYILAPEPLEGLEGTRAVRRFVEKPTREAATELLAEPGTCWNAGIFAWTRGSILDAFEEHAPDIVDGVEAALETAQSPAEAAPAPTALLAAGHEWPLAGDAAAEMYGDIRSISIDYAVMERAANVAVVPAAIGWSDVGSWNAVLEVQRALGGTEEAPAAAPEGGPEPGVVLVGPAAPGSAAMDIGSDAILVEPAGGRLVVTVGLRDTIVVDTPDAVLVCAADRAQEVRAIVERLTAARESDHL